MNFSDNYTQKVSDAFWGYQSAYQANYNQVKDEIENIPENITKEAFIKKLEAINADYRCSSRRFLVEFTRGIASQVFDDESFTVTYDKKEYHFSGSGMERIRKMDKKEKSQYQDLLIRISVDNSRDNPSDKKCMDAWKLIYRKALLLTDKATMLQRDDVLQIAHGLKFTLEMAESYLVRATDNDCFNVNRAEDLIEMFCFLHPEANNYHTANELRQWYKEMTSGLTPRSLDERPDRFTAMLEKDFPELIKEWESNLNEDPVDQFKKWLLSKAPYLNMTSRTSKNIYAALTYLADLILRNEPLPENYSDETAADIIADFCDTAEIPASVDWYQVEKRILTCAAFSFENNRVLDKNQFGTLWRYITTDSKGEVKAQAIGIGHTITDIVLGNKAITKADLLFMLWFVCELLWSLTQETNAFYDQLSDFWISAEELLEKCGLPEFYAPHLLEQSMLLSICSEDIEKSPFEIYEDICELLHSFKTVKPKKTPVSKSNETGNAAETPETDPDTKTKDLSTKQLRKLREAEIREDFDNDLIPWDGTEKLLFLHLMAHGQEMGQYVFTKEGISYDPNPAIIVPPATEETARLFDIGQPGYSDDEEKDARLTYLYSLYLYLRKECKKSKIKLKCRINYVKKCMIQILNF